MKEKVIVIGAGMGGLSAAIQLAHAGYSVEIYEQNQQPGGKMHQIHFDGHTFDVGPTLVLMPEAFKEVYSRVGKDYTDYIQLTQLDPMYQVYFAGDYRSYSISSDLTQWMDLLESKGGKNAQGFLNYLSTMYKRYQLALDHFIRCPFRHPRDFYNPKMIYRGLQLRTFDSAKNMLAKFLPDKDLQEMLSFQTLYIGISPAKGPSLYNIIPLIELLYGVWSLKGGMHAMAKGMATVFEELGGKIHYGSPVEEICIQDQQVQGILVDGQVIPSDIVISNVDFPYTMAHLVKDEAAKGKYTQEKIDKMDYSCSCLVYYWSVQGEYPDLGGHSFIISEDLDKNLEQIFNGERIDNPSVYLSIPSNIDPSMAPPGKSSFYVLLPVAELGTSRSPYTDDLVDYYRQQALAHLNKLPGLENIQDQILKEEVFTPHDFEEKFSAYRGATFGLQPSLRQSNHWRPQSKSLDCQGLYFTGSSTHPGAGVPIAIEGGRICASEVQKDYDTPTQTHNP